MLQNCYKREVKGSRPKKEAIAEVYVLNNIVEVRVIENKKTPLSNFKRVSKTQFLNVSTGEICDYHSGDKQKEFEKNMNQRFRYLKRFINTNFTGDFSELHIVLTYGREFSATLEELSADFKKFHKKFSYRYQNCEWLALKEPTETGRWHMHVLVKEKEGKRLYIESKILNKMWGKGYVNINRMCHMDDIGGYFTIYQSSLKIEENIFSKSKKSKRLNYYKPCMRIFTSSRGLKRPGDPLIMTYGEVEEFIDHKQPHYQKSIEIILKQEEVFGVISPELKVNTIHYQEYYLNDRNKP